MLHLRFLLGREQKFVMADHLIQFMPTDLPIFFGTVARGTPMNVVKALFSVAALTLMAPVAANAAPTLIAPPLSGDYFAAYIYDEFTNTYPTSTHVGNPGTAYTSPINLSMNNNVFTFSPYSDITTLSGTPSSDFYGFVVTDLYRNLSSDWQIDLTSSGVTLGPDFQSPTIAGGKLYFDFNGVSWTKGGSVTLTLLGTPEPATWAMVVLGFGAVGAAMRRRTRVAAKIAFDPT